MSGQMALAGFDAVPSHPTDRLFFAILPDEKAVARIERLVRDLRADLGLKRKALGAGRFHVTLHHVGDFVGLPEEVVELACKAAAAVAAAAPFKLAFDRVASFRRPRNMPLVLRGGDGLIALAAFAHELGTAMASAGLGRSAGAHYTPHLTLLYDDRHVVDTPIEPIAWTAREFVLVRSLIGQSRHEAIARLALCG
ncbi:2'-5' RNA ligase family protein [Variovorax paradoxus]|nr:2'-5' RNA ligase family protein [Variovorax paradoxus]